MDLLDSTTNPFRGVVPVPEALPADLEEFRDRLERSLSAWRDDGFGVVWLELPIARASHVPVAVDAGFGFHHSGADYLLMTLRLSDEATIPPFATHYIGAGGVVLNADNKLLAVRERFGRRGRPRSLKLPGGALDQGEHLEEGVVREVFEETGVKTRFQEVVCFRNQHGYRYGKSDIYFVCRLTPLSQEISMQAEEIEECLWIPVDQYLASDDVSPFNKHIVRAALDTNGLVPAVMDGYSDPDKYEFLMPHVYGRSFDRLSANG